MKQGVSVFAAILLLAWLAGCSVAPPTPMVVTIPAPVASPSPPAAEPTRAAIASDGLVLTWWTPEFISPAAPQSGGPLLATYLADFATAHGGKVQVKPVLKARYGKGGLLDYLRTAQPVAPGILPDLITLDVAELEQAAELGLLQPLDDLLAPDLIAGLYPFARQNGQFGGKEPKAPSGLVAVQFIADIEHLAYDRGRVPTLPATWTDLLALKAPYAFPAGTPQSLSATSPAGGVQSSLIGQYLSAGGVLDPATRQLTLQAAPLLRLLQFYSDARAAGVLPVWIVDVGDYDDAWTAYKEGSAALVNVNARRFMAVRAGAWRPEGQQAVAQGEGPRDTAFAALPGWNGPAAPVASGWALAIVTSDPVRRAAAAEFIAWLLAPERGGAWAQAAGWLPTSPAALATWGADPYNDFLDQQLANAIALPAGPDYPQTAVRLQKAVIAVLKDNADPREAAEAAINPPK